MTDWCWSDVIAGYDIRSEKGYEQMKAEFEEVIGRQYLKAVHINDSKGDEIFQHCLWIYEIFFINKHQGRILEAFSKKSIKHFTFKTLV